MAQVQKAWCEVTAWWIPVWISLPNTADATDPLEEATHELIKLGRGAAAEIAEILCLKETLVESALMLLEQRRIIQLGADRRWRSIEAPLSASRPVERAAWIAWDDLAQRPLLEVWLGKPPRDAHFAMADWKLVAQDHPGHDLESPKAKIVADALRALSRMPDIAAYESYGDRWRAVDLGTNRRIRINPMKRWSLRRIHVPVEFRATGPTVWRPSMVPVPTIRTELDPTGWDGLTARLSGLAQRELEHYRLDATNIIRPLLAQHGFESVEDLFESGRREARRELLGSWDTPGWAQLQYDVVNAVVDGRVAAITAPRRGWRQVLHGWCGVLDSATAAIVRCLGLTDESVRKARARPKNERRDAIERQRILGRSQDHLLKVAGNDEELRALERKVRRGLTIGERILAIALAYALDDSARNMLSPVLEECRSLFDELDEAVAVRNEIIHPRDQAFELIDASTFRQRVLTIVRATMRIRRDVQGRDVMP